MSGEHPPVTHRDAVRILTTLGFQQKPNKRGSHEQWIGKVGDRRRLVTLDKHHAPYAGRLLNEIIKQSGLSKANFYAMLEPKKIVVPSQEPSAPDPE